MRQKTISHRLNGLMALLLFGVFAACVLLVLLTGAGAYQRLTQRDSAAYDRRTCTQYIATRVRQGDVSGALTVETGAEGDTVSITEYIDGFPFVTRIYCYDGWLWELFAAAGEDMEPRAGEKIAQARALSAALEDGLLTVTVTTPDGVDSTVVLSVRSGREAVSP